MQATQLHLLEKEERNSKTLAQAEGLQQIFSTSVFFVPFNYFLKCLRYTTYEYKLIVHNEVGYTSSEEVIATTLAGLPEKGSILIARAVNHTAVEVEWSKPSKCA